jgi:hypothetical protein
MSRHGGFFPTYWDPREGKVFLQVELWDQEFLMLTALNSGLGSNPVGLDRGQLGATRVCRWRRVGPRVFLEQTNLKFRADAASEAERRAVRESFAPAVLWGGDVVAVESGAALVDVTSLVVSDRHGIAEALRGAGQGEFSLDGGRSFVVAERLRAFPDNVELHAQLTFTSGKPGSEVRAVAASGDAPSLGQRISLVRLPDPGYQPRPADPRVGAFAVRYADYAAPLDRSLFRSWMTRHRLQLDADGRVIEPIVYYVDAAAPEPIRSALVEGASWWSEAFAAAGFPAGFRVEVAPADMDPLDVRFHFIQWVHRQTRGWSYGASVVDPRTGEIIKGHVSLGSLRVRQDQLLLQNFTQTRPTRVAASCGMAIPASFQALPALVGGEAARETALARIRQLAAHEVGHTLGIAHNFAASTYGDRASVMDYPAPRLRVGEDGQIETADAYGVGVGSWDRFTVRCMYAPIEADPPRVETEAEQIDRWVRESHEQGLLYISDADARPDGGAHPLAHLWDNGDDPVVALRSVLRVREVGLQQFSPDVLLRGENSGDLQRAFVPLYLHHRYQATAVSKLIGGVDYGYSKPGDADDRAVPVEPERQRAAVAALMETLSPETLVVPPRILSMLVPASTRTAWDREKQSGFTAPTFDPLATAETAADLVAGLMLHEARLARLAQQDYLAESHPGTALVLEPLAEHALKCLTRTEQTPSAATARRIGSVITRRFLRVIEDEGARQDVRAEVRRRVELLAQQLGQWLAEHGVKAGAAEASWVHDRLTRALERPDLPAANTPPRSLPPGSPIGGR